MLFYLGLRLVRAPRDERQPAEPPDHRDPPLLLGRSTAFGLDLDLEGHPAGQDPADVGLSLDADGDLLPPPLEEPDVLTPDPDVRQDAQPHENFRLDDPFLFRHGGATIPRQTRSCQTMPRRA